MLNQTKTSQIQLKKKGTSLGVNRSSPGAMRNSPDFNLNQDKISLTEEDENKRIINEGTIVAKIDNIYMSIKDKDKPKYYSTLKCLILLIAICNITFQWMILSMISPMKNHYYCFDPFSREFKICDQSEFCDNTHYGIRYIIFTDNSNLSNKTVLNEIYNVNNKFLQYFLKDGITYSLGNAKMDKYKEIDTYYSIVIAMTTKENWNLFSIFRQYCNKQVLVVQIGIFCFVSMIFGNLILGYFADIYGRKKIIVLSCMMQFVGCCLIFFTTLWVLKSGASDGEFTSVNRSFKFDYTKDILISKFIETNTLDAFESQNINTIYKENFNENMQLLIDTNVIINNFSRFKIILLIGFLITFSAVSANANITLAYLLENSINDTDIYNNYSFFHYAIPISFLLNFILLTLIDNFHIPFLIIGSCLLILAFLLIFLGWESPRYHYEYYEYKEITKFFEKILDKDLIKKFYKTEDMPKFRKELKKQSYNISTCEVLCNKIMFLGYNQRLKRYKEMIFHGRFREVNRHELIRSPYLLFLLISNDKYIKQNILITISLTAIVGLIFFMTIMKFSLTLAYSREDMYSNIIVNSVIFYEAIVMCVSIAFFNFILKFFGFNIILFVCFTVIFLFSLIFELLSLGTRHPEDMNAYIYNSIEIIYREKGSTLVGILFVCTFFSTGVFTCVYFYLTKLTKTLFRCSFYGIFHCIFDLTTFFSLALSQYFEKNFFYVSVLSVIGFVNAYFIKEDFDFTILGDFRKIELEEDE